MPVFTPYAEVIGQEKVSRKLVGAPDLDGRPLTGKRLGEFRAAADSDTYLLPISERDKNLLQRIYDFTQDASCLEIKNNGYAAIPLEHLRDLDDETMVRVGYRLDFSREESRLLRENPH
jgi:hypothetical protein